MTRNESDEISVRPGPSSSCNVAKVGLCVKVRCGLGYLSHLHYCDLFSAYFNTKICTTDIDSWH